MFSAPQHNSNTLLFAVDMAGTFVFAVEGANAAIRGNLDLLGFMVLAYATAVGGGIIRDLLIGSVPPGAIRDWRYPAVAFLGAMVAFLLYRFVQQVPPQVLMVVDAAGLALFSVSGTGKALEYGMHPFVAVLMGGITGVGGGTISDILLAQIPKVLRADIYAVAALFGSAVMVIALKLKAPPALAGGIGVIACFTLRLVAVWQHWNLPNMMGK
jgi:uncharacterized membrane protein YeiH